jgi:polysaccharide deacetylase 2 family uncharacterized protein YibQ
VTRARISGWRGLGLFWAVVLLAVAGGAGTLAWLGPPPPAPVTAEAPPPAPPEPPPPAAVAAAPAPAPAPMPAPLLSPLPPPPTESRPAMRANARGFDRTDPRPRVAVIVGALGTHAQVAEQALRLLPPATGLAFSPYAEASQRLIGLARARGFETLLALPLEPTGFPLNDPGPRALLSGLPWGENAQRLDWLLARQTGHVGVVAALGPMRGERFAALVEPFTRVQDTVAARGMLFVDARPGAPAPARAWGRSLDLVLDDPPTRAELELRLGQLERIARDRGAALGYLGEAGPVALERIAQWAAGLEARGLVLAPPSALARAPEVALR